MIAADKDRVNNKTLQEAGYHNANNFTTDTVTIANLGTTNSSSTLTESISLQTTTNQANFTKILEILEKNGNRTHNPRNGPHNGRQLSYCWSHGRRDNTAHTGASCKNTKEGHIAK